MLTQYFHKWFDFVIPKRKNELDDYFSVLDGWRALAILMVLAAHLMPLGPDWLQLNVTSGIVGMSIFFTLSGFLITNFLLNNPSLYAFIIRRIFRILPLAWLYLVIVALVVDISSVDLLEHFLFYANWPPMPLISGVTSHFWSLCLEMQFYIGIAALFFLLQDKAFYFCILMCFSVTAYSVYSGVYVSINTYYRVDEILVGVILALIFNDRLGSFLKDLLRKANLYIFTILLVVASHPESGFFNYFRPYLAAILVGASLFVVTPSTYVKFLNLRVFIYIATISYALYVIHPLLAHYTWFGSGDGLEKYLKRPLLFLVLVIAAHVSTFYYERFWIKLAKKITNKK
jgi:peptidoglycan/LPS O-acetylase OafA/YrhL